MFLKSVSRVREQVVGDAPPRETRISEAGGVDNDAALALRFGLQAGSITMRWRRDIDPRRVGRIIEAGGSITLRPSLYASGYKRSR